MTSAPDVPQRPETLKQQPPRSFKLQIMRPIFILLLIINILFVSWIHYRTVFLSPYETIISEVASSYILC
jgi:hypothetical protein